MKMTVTKTERNLLLGILGVAIAVAVWFFYASPTIDKTNQLRSENSTLKIQAEEYEAVNARFDEYLNNIAQYKVEMEEILAHYPADVRTEDQMMFWANIDHAYPDEIAYGTVAIDERDYILVAGADDVNGANPVANGDGTVPITEEQAEAASARFKLCGAPMAMDFASTYDGMKDMLRYIGEQYEKNSIIGIEVDYDEEAGLLKGAVGVELYYILGTDKEYTPYFIPSVPKGQADIFHTTGDSESVRTVKAATEESTENEESEE